MDIGSAKIKIVNKNPFFGSVLMMLPTTETEDPQVCPTLGVNGTELIVNTKYWATLSSKEQYGVLVHEVGHLIFRHLWRGKNYTDIAIDPTTGQAVSLFNIAGDHVINNIIVEDSRLALPKSGCCDPKYKGWSTEEVYEDLRKHMKKATPQQMKDFMEKNKNPWCDKQGWGKGTPKEKKEQERKWENTTKQATEYARQRGYDPAWLKRLYEDLQPKEDWRTILREYIQPFDNDYTFSPADRRSLETDFILPDIQDGTKLDWVAIAVDTSGSIGGKELDSFIGEIKGIMSAYDSVRAKLTFCDAAATPFVELQDFYADKKKIEVRGGGGTDFRPVFDLVKKEDTQPLCLIYFTDTQGTFPQKAPEYDTIWIVIENGKVPWGKILKYKI